MPQEKPQPPALTLDNTSLLIWELSSAIYRLYMLLCPNVRYVSLCTGNHDIFIGAWLHSSGELTKFVKDYLANVPGIRKSETFVILDVKKDEIGWLQSLEQVDNPEA